MANAIQAAISARRLPDDLDEILNSLRETDGRYLSQEGNDWDFKAEWPFSYSDAYFGGLSRLVAAFANTNGGLIVFGVHDKKRTAGHNHVQPNIDKLQQALGQLLTGAIDLAFRRHLPDSDEAVELLLVMRRPAHVSPIRFNKRLENYPADVIWVREGYQVIAAEPRHIPLLYCGKSTAEQSEADSSLDASSSWFSTGAKQRAVNMATIAIDDLNAHASNAGGRFDR